jgi:hypothetical protein
MFCNLNFDDEARIRAKSSLHRKCLPVSMGYFHDHCPRAARQKIAAFSEETLFFYTAISPIWRRSKLCAIRAFPGFRLSETIGHTRSTALTEYKVRVVV